MSAYNACAVIPSRNHYTSIRGVISAIRSLGLPVYIVDDGSDEPARSALAKLHDPANSVTVIRLDPGQGKGGAVVFGFRTASADGFTHAIQIDADGQHDLGALPRLLELSQTYTATVISGQAVYDDTVPRARQIGRWVTHVWVWIETLSLRIRDSMCGFRAYPLRPVIALIDSERIGAGMDFDTEVLVRLHWRGVAVLSMPVKVIYPEGNTSNFDVLRDNWRISAMHTRLALTMLVRIPLILANRPPQPQAAHHWARLSERGLYWGLWFSALAFRLLGRRGCMVVGAPVALYFYLTGAEQRGASRRFLARAFAAQGMPRPVGWIDGYRHFLSFTSRAVDTFAGWSGGLTAEDITHDPGSVIGEVAADRGGALFIVAHVGNADLSRAVLDDKTRERLTVLVHTRHAEHYNRVLAELNPASSINTLQVTEIGPDTAIDLSERIERGEWIVIAGDRTPVTGEGNVTSAPFLGAEAPFATGPYILASLLDCPIYTLFCLRDGRHHKLYVEKFCGRVLLNRSTREEQIQKLAGNFAEKLEYYVLKDPYQWYNFFDFWARPAGENGNVAD